LEVETMSFTPNEHPSEWCRIRSTWRRIGGNDRVRVISILQTPAELLSEFTGGTLPAECYLTNEYSLLVKDFNLMTFMAGADTFRRNFVEDKDNG
jgi:hypothetical protein